MKKNEIYFGQFDSKIGYDGAVIHGRNSIGGLKMRSLGSLGYFLYLFLASLPIAYLLIKISSIIFEKIM
ncbi:hypothetical protein [Methanosarcina sp.]|uniref:hypothetical protein n=1 Tax=Methanosarcina sp. TaxID=2213 RepID=UPI002AB8C754|nr:hypothetical protein [Methanosarcina sp.]MDY9925736.1 hypothetical protein [Methanosarcina sp.]